MEEFNDNNDNTVDNSDNTSSQTSDTTDSSGTDSSSDTSTDTGSDTDNDDGYEEQKRPSDTVGSTVTDQSFDTDNDDRYEEQKRPSDTVGSTITDQSSDTNNDDGYEEQRRPSDEEIQDRINRLEQKLNERKQVHQVDATGNPDDDQDGDADGGDVKKTPVTPPAGSDANPPSDIGPESSITTGTAEGSEVDNTTKDLPNYGNAGPDPYADLPESHVSPSSDQYMVEGAEMTAEANGRAKRNLDELKRIQDEESTGDVVPADDEEASLRARNQEKIKELRRRMEEMRGKADDEAKPRPHPTNPNLFRRDGNER